MGEVVVEVRLRDCGLVFREDLDSSPAREALEPQDDEVEPEDDVRSEMLALGLPSAFVTESKRKLARSSKRRKKNRPRKDPAENSSAAQRELVVVLAECKEQAVGINRSPESKTWTWLPAWDDYYHRYYFYNSETSETTWDAPQGLEHLVNEAVDTEPHQANEQGTETTIDPESNLEELLDEDIELEPVSRSKKKRRKLDPAVLPEGISSFILKYWYQRYSFFSNFDKGIQMDEEGWFSVTPEAIAKHHAQRCASPVIVDAFTGVGGNAIQFAMSCGHVIAIDKDPAKIDYAKHNAEIYGVSDRIDFIVGDFFQLAPHLKASVIFLSPPWGGPEYCRSSAYDLQMLQPKDGFTLFNVAQDIAPKVALYLPRNVDLEQVAQLAWLSTPPLKLEVEKNFLNDKFKAVTVYYGDFAC